MGSVKDLEVLKPPTKNEMGVGRFHFSDRYSVFDWGAMPDLIENKGKALCLMGAFCFEMLEKMGIKTHYRGLVAPNEKLITTKELEEPVDIMEIHLARVFKPEFRGGAYDYNIFAKLAEKGLKKPIFEVSTKLEERDRCITWSEAQRISGLRDDSRRLLQKPT